MGGAGKTPAAIAVANRLRELGRNPHILTRGYKGRLSGPVRIDPDRHTARDVGDEPLLLAAVAPTWVARDRVAGAKAAVAAGADILVLDDGFQNPALAKDLSLVVIDGGQALGNGRLLPAGPLRETLARGLGRAQAVVLVGCDRKGLAACLPDNLTLLRARLVPDAAGAAALRGRRVLAFAGIGRPQKFLDSLREVGAQVAAQRLFADHHAYSAAEIEGIRAEAAKLNAVPVTTAKDAVRIPAELRAGIQVLEAVLAFDRPEELDGLLAGLNTTPA